MISIKSALSLEEKLTLVGNLCKWEVTEFSPLDYIYQATTKKGKVRLWKILLTNICRNNCYYCANRWQRDCPRFKINPEDLARYFWNLYQKGRVEGLFISSAEFPDPNSAQENIIKTISILRKKYKYRGYIHSKIMPKVKSDLIYETAKLSSRISLNMEAPGERYIKEIAPQKSFGGLLADLNQIHKISEKLSLPAGITTQFIIGIGKENDRTILSLAEKLYRQFKLRRIFYSPFQPIPSTPLEDKKSCNYLRELRIYQADFLIRDYGFSSSELVYDNNGNLYLHQDPKYLWAKKNFKNFPLEINKASFEQLLRVPGIGKITAKKILEIRKQNLITDYRQLKRLGIDFNICKEFLLFNGKKFH